MSEISKIIKNGGVGVLPTDTVYGLIGSAFSQTAVEKIYKIKNRDDNKSLIILISSVNDLKRFGVSLSEKTKSFMEKYWPGKISIILDFDNSNLSFLDKTGEGTLAFRFPDKKELADLIKETGPLVAPSANPQGMPVAKNIEEAEKYFADKVDFYEDGGELISEPSTIVKISKNDIEIIREGAVKI
jgi:L-threonylcarbamoyladenylate synthase